MVPRPATNRLHPRRKQLESKTIPIHIVHRTHRQKRRLTNIGHTGFKNLQSAQPLWAPDGSHIAFMEWGPGSDTWYVRMLQTNDMTILPKHIGISTTTAAWSPDSSKLAFAHYSTEERIVKPYLEITNRDGSQKIRTYLGPIPRVQAIAWHPEGSEILIGARSVYTFDVQDQSTRKLIPGPEGGWHNHITNLAWSPDGEKFAIRLGSLESHQTYNSYSCSISILTADRDGGNLTLIVSNQGQLPNPFTATNRPTTLGDTINDQNEEKDCPSPRNH